MSQSEYNEAVYLAKLIVSGRVPDWSVSYDGIKQLANALIQANSNQSSDPRLLAAVKSLKEIVDHRTRVVENQGGSFDGSDGRYARAREALRALGE